MIYIILAVSAMFYLAIGTAIISSFEAAMPGGRDGYPWHLVPFWPVLVACCIVIAIGYAVFVLPHRLGTWIGDKIR